MHGNEPSLTSAEPEAILRLSGVSFAHGGQTVLHGIDLALVAGTLTTLLGPSGSGKTTLLRIIAGHLQPAPGTVWLGGQNATHFPPEERGLGMVHQHLALFPHLSARRNVSFGLEVRGMPRREACSRADATLDLVGLEVTARDRLPDTLSGGQKQRVAIGRALAFGPKLLLLDEPFTALDRQLRQQMRGELKRIQRESSVTTLLVTHDQEEALGLSESIIALRDGRVVQQGAPAELYQRPRDPWLAGFLGDANLVTTGFFTRSQPGEVLLVRPEELLPGTRRDHGDGDCPLIGQAHSVSFRGASCLVTFEADGLFWKMLVPGENSPRVGDRIEAILPATAGWNISRGCRP